jgi:hypothetical protein
MCTTSLIDEHQRQRGVQQQPTSTASSTVVPTTTQQQQQPMTLLIGENGQVLSTTATTMMATSPEHFCEMQSQTGGDEYEDPVLQPPSILVRKSEAISQEAEPSNVSINVGESELPPSTIGGRKKSVKHDKTEQHQQQQPSTSSASTNTD